ncbi:MAG: transporter associated domain-containing protein [Pseudomonadota bacterium]
MPYQSIINPYRGASGRRKSDFHTLGGFIMSYLERIPATGDHFLWEEWRFEIVDMYGNRIDKVLPSSPPASS